MKNNVDNQDKITNTKKTTKFNEKTVRWMKKTNQLKRQEKTQVDALKKLIEKTRINWKKNGQRWINEIELPLWYSDNAMPTMWPNWNLH